MPLSLYFGVEQEQLSLPNTVIQFQNNFIISLKPSFQLLSHSQAQGVQTSIPKSLAVTQFI